MIATIYILPFAFDASVDNPWDGRRTVDLMVHGATPFNEQHVRKLHEYLEPFWSLARVGGLAGTLVAPWLSTCKEPRITVQRGKARFQFEPCLLDEGATHCLICLLIALHDEIPLEHVILSTSGGAYRPVSHDPKLLDPYPRLWGDVPFRCELADSESEDVVLRLQFAAPLITRQAATIYEDLMRWGSAAAAGAFGIAQIEPRSCDCLPVNPLEHYEGEVIWAIEKCRFHYAALRSLVAVCATIHHRAGTILDLSIE